MAMRVTEGKNKEDYADSVTYNGLEITGRPLFAWIQLNSSILLSDDNCINPLFLNFCYS